MQSIVDQTEDIDESADELFLAVLIGVAVIGSLVVVVAVLLAVRISAPLVRVGNKAERMAGNIGDDLLKGVSSGGDDGCGPKIKEMQDLRVAFEGIVSERKKLQSAKKGRADNPPNPFYSVHLDIERPATSPLPPWQARING